jgi:hypothetical protein
MYTKGKNGERVEVNLPMATMHMPNNGNNIVQKEAYEKPEGSNKSLLYVALVFGLVVVAGSAYMLYRDQKKKPQNDKFGYSLH